MPIRSGIGIGGAQIFDTSGIQDAYYKQYLQKQKQDQAYAEDLANNLAKYDTTGLLPKDVTYADSLYQSIKDKVKNSNPKTEIEKRLLNAEIKSGMQKIKEFAYNAKKYPAVRQKIAEEFGKNRFMYPDEVINSFDKNVKDKSYYELLQSGIGDINQLLTQRNPDNTLIDKSLKTLDAQLKDVAEKNVKGIKTEFTPDKKQQVYQYTTDQGTAKLIAKSLLTNDATKANWYYNFKKNNPNVEPNDDVVADYIVKQREAMYQGNPYTFKGGVKAVAKDKSSGGAGGSGGVGSDLEVVQPIELNIPFAKGKGVVNVKDYVKLPMAKQNFAGSGYIDMSTGKPSVGKLESSNDYEVVGVGNFPIITNGNMKGGLSQPNYIQQNPSSVELKPMVHVQKIKDGLVKDLLIPYDRLPISKKISKKLANFRPQTIGSSNVGTSQSNSNSVKGKKSIKGF